MPFGKTIKRVVAHINMENGFDIEVIHINSFLYNYKELSMACKYK